jgi:hypothetical protein
MELSSQVYVRFTFSVKHFLWKQDIAHADAACQS